MDVSTGHYNDIVRKFSCPDLLRMGKVDDISNATGFPFCSKSLPKERLPG